ncbi:MULTISPECIES: hypothetical protein [unclassified Caballeronia]|uniref:hypothetical protein n=1 Tax=unclassified Caballeronia TaxID=2646786 RepID=UPI002866E1D4|nr:MULTISPECIES: hypothetical protein [unclassified Caballeronia]MDR5752281.1 hypothetical protein [Caballeronia sp. LZ024]MDR5841799.1 hypothetical protein [Caballeronia sp. LZ031]
MRSWLALIVAPCVALACLSVNYLLVWTMTSRCPAASAAPLNGVSAGSLAVCVAATVFAWLRWRSTRNDASADSPARPARAGFVAAVATGVGVLSAASVIVMAIPQWLLAPC